MNMEKNDRAPMLSMEQINAWAAISKHYETAPKDLQEHECRTMKHSAFMGGITTAMEWYESKITSGELRVVNKVGVELVPNDYDCQLTCTGCGDGAPYYLLEEFDDMNFCPNCGAEIVKG